MGNVAIQKLSLRGADLDHLLCGSSCTFFSGRGKEHSYVLLGKYGWQGENEQILWGFSVSLRLFTGVFCIWSHKLNLAICLLHLLGY